MEDALFGSLGTFLAPFSSFWLIFGFLSFWTSNRFFGLDLSFWSHLVCFCCFLRAGFVMFCCWRLEMSFLVKICLLCF